MGSYFQNILNRAKELYRDEEYAEVIKTLKYYEYGDDYTDTITAIKLLCQAKVNFIITNNKKPQEIEEVLYLARRYPHVTERMEALLLYYSLEIYTGYLYAKRKLQRQKGKKVLGGILWIMLKLLKVAVSSPKDANKGVIVFVDIVNSEYDKNMHKKIPLTGNLKDITKTVKYIKYELVLSVSSNTVKEAFKKDLEIPSKPIHLKNILIKFGINL